MIQGTGLWIVGVFVTSFLVSQYILNVSPPWHCLRKLRLVGGWCLHKSLHDSGTVGMWDDGRGRSLYLRSVHKPWPGGGRVSDAVNECLLPADP